MKLHKRTLVVQKADAKISLAICKIASEHDLTFGEIVSILGGQLQIQAKYAIREERHGDASKEGDVE